MTMKKNRKLTVRIVLILNLIIYAGGCTAVVLEAGNQAYTHLRGDLLGIVPDKLPDSYKASIMAMGDLSDFHIAEKNLNTLKGHIVAYDKEAREVLIDLFRTEHDQTRIQIRIGLTGDKLESVMIYDHIKKYLPSSRSV